MKIHVINLDRSVDRIAEFRKANHHIDATRFPAIDGTAQSSSDLVGQGLIASDLKYSVGAIGAALSHLRLWEMCVEQNAPVTVCEDDAVLHLEFEAASARLIGELPADWDIVLWTWSFRTAVYFDLLKGSGSCLALCDFQQMNQNVTRYQETKHAFTLYRLYKTFGAMCYTISPKGARKLKSAALPLRPMAVRVPLLDEPVTNYGIDVVMCDQYEKLAAFVCVPPLAIPAEKYGSTIQGTQPFQVAP
ncbi:MAG TPA: glycosyltransferase family 25 protein [Burkholderiales bacterium]|nr:glycosyltransferase family 25 protein [Burkholderiales bacterium]